MHRSSKERRAIRETFIKSQALIITDLIYKGKEPEIRKFCEEVARPVLEYSDTTYVMDIWTTLRRDYLRIYSDNKHA